MLEIKYLLFLLKSSKSKVIISLILTIFNIFISLISVSALAPIVSFLVSGANNEKNIFSFVFEKIYNFFGFNYNFTTSISFFSLLFIFSLISTVLVNYSILKLKYNVVLKLINSSLKEILSSNVTILFKKNLGEINNTFNREIEKISNSFTLILRSLSSLFYVLSLLVFVFFIDFKIASIIMFIFIILFLSLLFIKNYLTILGNLNTSTGNRITGELMETFSLFKLLKMFSIEEDQINKITKFFKIHQGTTIKLQTLNTSIPLITQGFSVISIYIVFIYFGTEVSLINLSLILLALQRSINPISQILHGRISLNIFSAAFKQLNKILDESKNKSEIKGSLIFNELKEKIIINNISFEYDDKAPVLSNLSFEFKKNSINIIKGESGQGKSTLIDILLGLLKPTQGEVKIDNSRLSDFDLKSLRANIGYVPQDIVFFNTTIIENIVLGNKKSYDRLWLEEILELSGLKDTKKIFFKGLNTNVGDMGFEVSGGQKQRIAIARAIFRNPKILIVDEPTSFLDKKNSLLIINTLKKLSQRMLVIISTHDKELMQIGDHVLDLDKIK